MKYPIDASWYQRPKDIWESTSAGGIIVRIAGGAVWIALVKESDFPDYILPKGRIEKGETLEAAARREILEEAGISDLQLVAELGSRQRLNYMRNCWITVHYFLFVTSQIQAEPTDREHSYRCYWFRLDQLPGMFWPEQRQLVEENRWRIEALIT
jgi:8-oxo-dGTP pyrophosphatase MutT (NUDIX family)